MTGFQTFKNFHQLSESNAVLTNFQTFKTPVYLYTGSKVKVSTPPRKHGKSISNFQGERPHARPARSCAHAERAKNGPRSAPRRNRPIHPRRARARATRNLCPAPVCPRGHPRPPIRFFRQTSPCAHRAKSRQLFASRFFGRFWTGNAPQGDAAPGPADMGEARPQDEPFPAPLAAMGADREPTGSADGGRASPAHRGGKIVGPARPIEADGRGRRGERPLQHDISRA